MDPDTLWEIDVVHQKLVSVYSTSPASLLRNVYEKIGQDPIPQIQDMLERMCESEAAALRAERPDDTLMSKIDGNKQALLYLEHFLSAFRAAQVSLEKVVAVRGPQIQRDDLPAGAPFFSTRRAKEDEKNTTFQELLLYLFTQANLKGYRRVNTDVYKRLVLSVRREDGEIFPYDTHSWTRLYSIRDFVYDQTRKDVNYEQWKRLTSNRTNIVACVDYLAQCYRDYQFPDLIKNRSVFSFRNGIYVAYDENLKCSVFYDRDVDVPTLPQSLTACKFFDIDFDPDWITAPDWESIPTPHLDSIARYQGYDDEVMQWFYVMIGRLLYNVGYLDNWQVMPFFKGEASSGKSTLLLKVCKAFYEDSDVSVLSNNIETKFGLSALCDKLLFVAPEIKGDLRIDQAEFQSMVSGEMIQINEKNKTARSMVWSVPGIMAGNEVPNWVDNAGSIARRIVLFEFRRRVDNGDMLLGDKISSEIAAIIAKCNMAYLSAVGRFKAKNIWACLPQYFHQTKQALTEQVNSLESFLQSSDLMRDETFYMPFDAFKKAYNRFCENNNLPKHKLTKDFYQSRMERIGLSIVKDSRAYPRVGGCVTTKEWVCGLDVMPFVGNAAAAAAAGGAAGPFLNFDNL